MRIERTTSPYPASDFITVAEAAFQVKGDETFDSAFLTRAITSSIKRAEDYTERAFINQVFTLTLRKFPSITNYNPLGAIFLPRGKAQSITSVSYVDTDGVTQTLVEDTGFKFSNNGDTGAIIPSINTSWPETNEYTMESVTVVYTAGYGSTLPDDKQDIVNACLVDIGTQYQVRQGMSAQSIVDNGFWKRMLNDYKVYFDFTINDE